MRKFIEGVASDEYEVAIEIALRSDVQIDDARVGSSSTQVSMVVAFDGQYEERARLLFDGIRALVRQYVEDHEAEIVLRAEYDA